MVGSRFSEAGREAVSQGSAAAVHCVSGVGVRLAVDAQQEGGMRKHHAAWPAGILGRRPLKGVAQQAGAAKMVEKARCCTKVARTCRCCCCEANIAQSRSLIKRTRTEVQQRK
eukprot:6194443-Pleurochrysis_carterae.AAC.2